jgi:predicted tellurium resistance membrane protein TerC
LWQAVWFILVADVTMSIDNILAVAAASKGSLALLIFGLGLSIPFVVFTSNLLSRIMDQYPIVVYAGAAILGRVGGELMIGDPWIVGLLHPSTIDEIVVQAFFAMAVLVAGAIVNRHLKRPARE